jgi:hypothetical protein
MSRPWQVYTTGIGLPLPNAVELSVNALALGDGVGRLVGDADGSGVGEALAMGWLEMLLRLGEGMAALGEGLPDDALLGDAAEAEAATLGPVAPQAINRPAHATSTAGPAMARSARSRIGPAWTASAERATAAPVRG